MYNNRRNIGSSQPVEAWKAAVVRDRMGEASRPAGSRPFPFNASGLPPRPVSSHPPALHPSAIRQATSRLPASNPFASRPSAIRPATSRLPAAHPFASRHSSSHLQASRSLQAPRDGDSDSSESNVSSSHESSDVFQYDLKNGLKSYEWGVDENRDEAVRDHLDLVRSSRPTNWENW
jgi:hypothetical protein